MNKIERDKFYSFVAENVKGLYWNIKYQRFEYCTTKRIIITTLESLSVDNSILEEVAVPYYIQKAIDNINKFDPTKSIDKIIEIYHSRVGWYGIITIEEKPIGLDNYTKFFETADKAREKTLKLYMKSIERK